MKRYPLTMTHVALIGWGCFVVATALFFMVAADRNKVYDMAVRQQTEVIEQQAAIITDQGQVISELWQRIYGDNRTNLQTEKPAPFY